jgi:uncharacterized membrane protein
MDSGIGDRRRVVVRSAVLASILRTVVPMVWAAVLSWPVTGPVLDVLGVSEGSAERLVSGATTVVVGSVYYSLVRWLESRREWAAEVAQRARRRWPWIVLLGWHQAPVYDR